MALDLVPTSELEAVNTLLNTIGEAPINSLETSGSVDVAIARQTIHEVSRQVQTTGWHFNSEKEFPMARDMDNKIPVPPNALSIDTSAIEYDYDVTRRGDFLYDRKEHTFIFDKTLKCDVVWFLPFEDLPQSARNYITIRAARVFQGRQLTSQVIKPYTDQEEFQAQSDFVLDEGLTADYNILSDSDSVASVLER